MLSLTSMNSLPKVFTVKAYLSFKCETFNKFLPIYTPLNSAKCARSRVFLINKPNTNGLMMILKFKLWKYDTLNSKDSHKNSVKNSINHKNSSTREIQKHKDLKLVKAVKNSGNTKCQVPVVKTYRKLSIFLEQWDGISGWTD
jgi:hypothetical protein